MGRNSIYPFFYPTHNFTNLNLALFSVPISSYSASVQKYYINHFVFLSHSFEMEGEGTTEEE